MSWLGFISQEQVANMDIAIFPLCIESFEVSSVEAQVCGGQ